MLTTLPYTGLEQNGSLTIFYFDRNSFNFPEKHVELIKNGKFRKIPVVRIFDQNRNTLIVVADTPESYWHTRSSEKVLYVPQNQRVDSLIEYAKKRPIFLRENMISFFEIDGKVQKISIISDEQRGSVKINQIIANGNWEGDYLGGIPLKITAIPNDDYEFVKWKNRKLGKNSTVIIDPSNIQEVIPIFEKRSFVHNK